MGLKRNWEKNNKTNKISSAVKTHCTIYRLNGNFRICETRLILSVLDGMVQIMQISLR